MALRLTRLEFERLQARRVQKTGAFTRREPREKPNTGRRWEIELAAQLTQAGLPHVREYRFLEDRRFRFDFAFPVARLAVEVDGAVHRIKKRFHADQEKGQLALLGEWRVLHVTPAQVRSGAALALTQQLLGVRTR